MLSLKSKMHNDKRMKGAARSSTAYCLLSTVYSRAFSLAELMVAVGILGIGMLIIASAFPVALDQTRQALELSTSQMVFNEAVNQLKTKVTWTELEQYINPDPNEGALEDHATFTTYRLGPNENPNYPNSIYLLSFDNDVRTDPTVPPGGPIDFFTNPVFENSNCAYSADNTYGWMAAVQKIGNQCYKFWIFVLREPTGIVDGTTVKFKWRMLNATSSPHVFPTPTPDPGATAVSLTNRLIFNDTGTLPTRETPFLTNTGQLYKITDIGSPSSGNQIVMCDKPVSDGIEDTKVDDTMKEVSAIAYPYSATGVTRKNPVVAVFQTVISY
jgi:prepilin-type N-terminal cleavage/methylation domain-containing protein